MQPTLREILPGLFSEMEESLRKLGRIEVIEQLDGLRLERWTHDSEANAMYLYVIGGRELNVVEENIIGVKYGESLPLDDVEGLSVIDLDNFGRIQGLELIGRRDVLKKLKKCRGL